MERDCPPRGALYVASDRGYEEIVQFLLGGADIDARSEKYGTALEVASRKGQAKVVQLLLTKGTCLGHALQEASSRNREKVVLLLLEGGAAINAHGLDGTAHEGASLNGHRKVVRLLLQKGAHIGRALQMATDAGHDKVAQILLEAIKSAEE